METNLRDGYTGVASWHLTHAGATVAAADLVCTAQGNVILGDWFAWEVAHARSPLVAAALEARSLQERRLGVTAR